MPKPNQELRDKIMVTIAFQLSPFIFDFKTEPRELFMDNLTDAILNLIELEKIQARIDECKTGDSPEEWRQYRLSQLEAQKKEVK